ncbi:hypothetical protein [Coleofasciculus sp.]|uniref:hypothetical protein n=1 Tax=Coleofasciculus sp. TaxID=3100458 RepID=UPI003A2C9971
MDTLGVWGSIGAIALSFSPNLSIATPQFQLIGNWVEFESLDHKDAIAGLKLMCHLSKGQPDTIEWMGSVH